MADDKKVIFSMVGVSKIYPPQKQVLKNIYLSFFYGAKIGIIGLNGSGKSTLLKIIAGLDKQYQGEVVFSPGYTVGYLEQDPKLDPSKTVKEIVQEGVQPILDLLAEFDKVNESFADPDVLEDPDKMDKLINRQAELQDKLDAVDAWNIDNKLERAMDALRCPPEDQNVTTLSGGERRRVALCRLLLQILTFYYSTSLPTTWMQNLSTGLNSICSSTRVQLLQLRTTATSLTTLQAGFLSWTAVKVFLGKATTVLGLIKRLNVWRWKKSRQASAARLLSASWNGLEWHQRHVRQKVKHVCHHTTDYLTKTKKQEKKNLKYLFLTALA